MANSKPDTIPVLQRSAGTKSKRVAQAKLDAAEIRAAKGEVDPVLLSDFLDGYLTARSPGLTESGRIRYEFCRDILAHPHSPLCGLVLAQIDPAAVTRFLLWRRGHGRSKATVLKEVGFATGSSPRACSVSPSGRPWSASSSRSTPRGSPARSTRRWRRSGNSASVMRPDSWPSVGNTCSEALPPITVTASFEASRETILLLQVQNVRFCQVELSAAAIRCGAHNPRCTPRGSPARPGS
jgi:hypothetical protein